MIRVVLVDDEPRIRRGLQMHLALEPGVVVIGEAGSGSEAIELVQAVAGPAVPVASTASSAKAIPERFGMRSPWGWIGAREWLRRSV